MAGLALACLESGVLVGALVLGSVELMSQERVAMFGTKVPRVVTGVKVEDEPIDGLDAQGLQDELAARSSAWLDAPMRLESQGRSFDTTPRQLGAKHDPRHAVHEALTWGRNPSLFERVKERLQARGEGIEIPLRARIDPAKARALLEELAPSIERDATPGRVDLKRRQFLPPTPARGLLIEETIPRVALAMAQGQGSVQLATYAMVPPEQSAQLRTFPNISTIVGQSAIPVDPRCKGKENRQINRARAIAALDGWIVAPQERIHFWNAVGEPAPRRGFVAALACPPNAQPERIGEGLSTLASAIWSAGFFAGMDLLQAALPEDRIYGVELGLDAQVRWPSDGMELANPHDFALVLHVKEEHGQIVAQWLGQARPFKISMERVIERTKPFETLTRPAPKALLGSRTVLRAGRPGYTIKRTRLWQGSGLNGRRETVTLKYPPRSAVESVGEDPLGPPPRPEKFPVRSPDAEDPIVRITR